MTIENEKIYREVLAEFVAKDAFNMICGSYQNNDDNDADSFDETKAKDIAGMVGERWAYNGDCDCNLSYWDNINNLIKEETEIY